MELQLDTHYKYDTVNRYYYLTLAGAELATGIDKFSKVWTDADRRLRNQGKQLKELMSMSTNDDKRQRYSRRDYVEYAQYTFDIQKQSVLFMLSEFAETSYDDDIDRIPYDASDGRNLYSVLPYTMKSNGSDSGMLFIGQTCFVVPEDEYRVGY